MFCIWHFCFVYRWNMPVCYYCYCETCLCVTVVTVKHACVLLLSVFVVECEYRVILITVSLCDRMNEMQNKCFIKVSIMINTLYYKYSRIMCKWVGVCACACVCGVSYDLVLVNGFVQSDFIDCRRDMHICTFSCTFTSAAFWSCLYVCAWKLYLIKFFLSLYKYTPISLSKLFPFLAIFCLFLLALYYY